MRHLKTYESYQNDDDIDLIDKLIKMGWKMEDLSDMSDDELRSLYMMEEETDDVSEKNWISDAIKNPGSLRRRLRKKKGDNITKSEIDKEISSLRRKDKDKSKPGIQGLNKSDLSKYRQLNLSKTLRNLKRRD